MIPKFNAYTKRNIDLRKIKWPGDILYEHDEGIPANHEYRNMTGFSWDCFLETYEAEVKYINDASRRSKTV